VEVYDSVALKLKPVLTRSIILGVPQPGTWWEVEERLADGTWVKPALPNPIFYQVIRQDPNGEISINTFVGSKLPWVQHVPTNYWTDAGLGISRFVASPGLVP
jgi:hypothetical protein